MINRLLNFNILIHYFLFYFPNLKVINFFHISILYLSNLNFHLKFIYVLFHFYFLIRSFLIQLYQSKVVFLPNSYFFLYLLFPKFNFTPNLYLCFYLYLYFYRYSIINYYFFVNFYINYLFLFLPLETNYLNNFFFFFHLISFNYFHIIPTLLHR